MGFQLNLYRQNNRMQCYVNLISLLCYKSLLFNYRSSWSSRILLMTGCIICCWGLFAFSWSNEGQIPETLSGQSLLLGTKSSMSGRSLRPSVVEVCCARQCPPMRSRSLRLFLVEVCWVRQSPLIRGGYLRHFKVRCTRQSPPTRGRSLRLETFCGQNLLLKAKSSDDYPKAAHNIIKLFLSNLPVPGYPWAMAAPGTFISSYQRR